VSFLWNNTFKKEKRIHHTCLWLLDTTWFSFYGFLDKALFFIMIMIWGQVSPPGLPSKNIKKTIEVYYKNWFFIRKQARNHKRVNLKVRKLKAAICTFFQLLYLSDRFVPFFQNWSKVIVKTFIILHIVSSLFQIGFFKLFLHQRSMKNTLVFFYLAAQSFDSLLYKVCVWERGRESVCDCMCWSWGWSVELPLLSDLQSPV